MKDISSKMLGNRLHTIQTGDIGRPCNEVYSQSIMTFRLLFFSDQKSPLLLFLEFMFQILHEINTHKLIITLSFKNKIIVLKSLTSVLHFFIQVLIVERLYPRREYYFAITLDRSAKVNYSNFKGSL